MHSLKSSGKSSQLAEYEIPIGDYYKLNARKKLGSGAFGDIYLGTNLKNKRRRCYQTRIYQVKAPSVILRK